MPLYNFHLQFLDDKPNIKADEECELCKPDYYDIEYDNNYEYDN